MLLLGKATLIRKIIREFSRVFYQKREGKTNGMERKEKVNVYYGKNFVGEKLFPPTRVRNDPTRKESHEGNHENLNGARRIQRPCLFKP